MCGIFAYLGDAIDPTVVREHFEQIKYRGPDGTQWTHPNNAKNLTFGFHRLAINGLDEISSEPLNKDGLFLICNGEIYNAPQLIQAYNLPNKTTNDCEVILLMYQLYGPDRFVELLDQFDGVFSLVLYDSHNGRLFIANDPIGIRPLYWSSPNGDLKYAIQLAGVPETNYTSPYPSLRWEFAVASEPRALNWTGQAIHFFPPGHYFSVAFTPSILTNPGSSAPQMLVPISYQFMRFYHYSFPINLHQTREQIINSYRSLLSQAVRKRLLSDRPIGCLLSGGLDSSLVTALVAGEFKRAGKRPPSTFSIGLPGSPDVYWAQIVANHLGTDHHVILVDEAEFLGVIPEVIKGIQSYDITTVRASCGNWLLGKYIKKNTDCVVIFNGDVSEEIHASYLYCSRAPDPFSFHEDNLRLLREVHKYDVLRSARSMENHSLEPRSPFADKNLVRFVMSIDPNLKFFGKNGRIEKELMRASFPDLLPTDVLYRKKTAFSDGVSDQNRSWHDIIREFVDVQVSDEEFESQRTLYTVNPPPTKEAYYYRKIYEEILPNQGHLIPKYWMPRFVPDAQDPSARTLEGYAE